MSTDQAHPTTDSPWIKARASGGSGGNCVQIRRRSGQIQVRDSKNPTGDVLTFIPTEFNAFLTATKHGEFDPT